MEAGSEAWLMLSIACHHSTRPLQPWAPWPREDRRTGRGCSQPKAWICKAFTGYFRLSR